MQEIMFNDKYRLTQNVLEGIKTHTRRIIPQSVIDKAEEYRVEYYDQTFDVISLEDILIDVEHLMGHKQLSKFKVGEEVAIAQSYKDAGYTHDLYQTTFLRKPTIVKSIDSEPLQGWVDMPFDELKGWNNKMFVRADLMPHRIKITDIRVERLQDISDEDCMKEGIMEWNPKDEAELVVIKNLLEYNERNGHFPFQISRCWNMYDTPRQAFADLIDKTCGNGTWNLNPYVFVYEFGLIK